MLETQRERVPGNDGGELDTALAFLGFQRACVFKKIEGLDEEQLRRRLVVSDTTLLGLVKHLADGERWWFAHHVGGDPAYADTDFSLVVPDEVSADEVVADYRAAIAESDRHIAAAGSPDTKTQLPVGDDGPKTLRWVLAHMTAETARHLGHLDILREQIDETTGR
ncbi:DinB family protein [Nocardioides sp. SR21]|uniref:DinB family protein n=1 Tax=Nocardioides sp. SR21 TaxID=2919501 RepID=UPI001FA98C0B|nr:DinB family protein [Nocardioides sp. SR21]